MYDVVNVPAYAKVLSVPSGEGDGEGVGVEIGVADAAGAVVGRGVGVALAVVDGVVFTVGVAGPEEVPLQAVSAPSEIARPSDARRKK